MPKFDAIDRRHALQNVTCLRCSSGPGKRCTNARGDIVSFHTVRLRQAQTELEEGLQLDFLHDAIADLFRFSSGVRT
jgi:hypothetical protein